MSKILPALNAMTAAALASSLHCDRLPGSRPNFMPGSLGDLGAEFSNPQQPQVTGLGSLGNWMYNNNLDPALAFVGERNVSNMRPYNEKVYNTHAVYFHARDIPTTGLAGETKFFDGNVAQTANQKFLTNWSAGNGVLPKNTVFTVRALAVKIVPLLSMESNTPTYASTALQLQTTASAIQNAETFKRMIDTFYWEFFVQDRSIAQGLGLDDLCTPAGPTFSGVHTNDNAATINSFIDGRNVGADFGFQLPVPIAIMPNDRIELRVTPTVASLAFVDHAAAAAKGCIIAKMFGDKAVLKG